MARVGNGWAGLESYIQEMDGAPPLSEHQRDVLGLLISGSR